MLNIYNILRCNETAKIYLSHNHTPGKETNSTII